MEKKDLNEKEKDEETLFHFTKDILEDTEIYDSEDSEDDENYLTPKKGDDVNNFLDEVEQLFQPLKVKNVINEEAPESNWDRFLFLRKKVCIFLKDKKIKNGKDFEYFFHSEIKYFLTHISFCPSYYLSSLEEEIDGQIWTPCSKCISRILKTGKILKYLENKRNSLNLLKKCKIFYVASNFMIEIITHQDKDSDKIIKVSEILQQEKINYEEHIKQSGLSLEQTNPTGTSSLESALSDFSFPKEDMDETL